MEQESTSRFAEYFKEVIYGGIDGIVTTFAVVAGFAGAALSNETTTQLSFLVVLLFGLANLFADATSMGLGNFLSVRSEKDLYGIKRVGQKRLVNQDRVGKMDRTISVMQERGFTEEQAKTLAETYATNEEYWVDFLMQHELEFSDPRGENEVVTGLTTFFSFMVFGAIPLLPFMFQTEGDAATAFMYSSIGTGIALVLLGLLKWKTVGSPLGKSLFEVIIVGGVAAVIAYGVGTFFSL